MAPDETEAGVPLATSPLVTVATFVNGVPSGWSSTSSCQLSPSGSVAVALKITVASFVGPPKAIAVTPSVLNCPSAVTSGEFQRIVEVAWSESAPAPWSFSKGPPARAPVLFVCASTRRLPGVVPDGVEMLKGLGAPVLPKVQPDTVKAPAVWRNLR